jgi:hypothetical protein
MGKKTLAKRVVALAIPLLLSSCVNTPGSSSSVSNQSATLWKAYNCENLMADLAYPDYQSRGSSLSFSASKGEEEAAQLMITAEKNIVSFDFEVGELSDGTHALPASSLSVYAEYYVDVTRSNEPDSYFGYYPDALIPLPAFKFRKMNYIDKGRNQGLWLNLSIPRDAVAGTYQGKGTLHLDEETFEIPLEAKIYDFALPEQVHEQSTFHVWYDQIKDGEGTDKAESLDFQLKYYDFMVQHRIMPNQLPLAIGNDPLAFATYVAEHVADNPQISSLGMPYKTIPTSEFSWGYKLDADKLDAYFSALSDKQLALLGEGKSTDLFKKLHAYFNNLVDEPPASRYDVIRDTDLQITKVKLKYAAKFASYPAIQKSISDFQNIVTVAYNADLEGSDTVGGVQTWCPTFQNFQTADQRAVYSALQKKTTRTGGEHVWWYGCIRPTTPFSSYHTDAKLLTARLLPWMEKGYGIEGNLYWGTNYWRNNSNYALRDIWHDPAQSGDCNGDGLLVYPGLSFGIDGPISTLRLENIREGEEEYEYLWLFEQQIALYNAQYGKSVDSQALLERYYQKLFTGILPNTDPVVFASTREELLGALERIQKDLKTGIESLL